MCTTFTCCGVTLMIICTLDAQRTCESALLNTAPVWLNRPREELYTRIDARVDRMLASGAIEEVAAAGPISITASRMIGVAEIRQYLRNEITLAQCADAMKQATRQYAKRQLTWFRTQRYIAISPETDLSDIVDLYQQARIDNREHR